MAVNVLNQEGNQMRRLVLGIAIAASSLVPTIGMADDRQIAEFIKGRLAAEQQQGNLKGFNVDMRVDRGTVWFKGHVSNSQQEQLILKAAQSAGHLGVVQVVDDIDVRGTSEPTPQVSLAPPTPQIEKAQPAPQSEKAPPASQSVMAQPMQQQPMPAMDIEASPFRNAGYQQPTAAPEQFQQTSNQESMPIDARQGIVNNGQPMAFATSANAAPPRVAALPMNAAPNNNMPMAANMPIGAACQGPDCYGGGGYGGEMYGAPMAAGYGGASAPAEAPNLPGYAWPGYAAHPNYGAVSYPKQYSPSAWPYIGPFYPYPQVPLGWRKVTLEWDDGWWMLDFKDK